jgi:hypothetical protein
MKPTKNHFWISDLATKVTSAFEPTAMMSVHETWLETISVARSCDGAPITFTFMPRKVQPNQWNIRGIPFQLIPSRLTTNCSGTKDDQERDVAEDEEQDAQDHFLFSSALSGTA